MTCRLALQALSGALAVLVAGCASGGGAGSGSAPSAACASAAAPVSASLAPAFDSLFALRQRGRSVGELVLAPHDVKPRLANADEVGHLLKTLYPPTLRNTGAGGTTEVAILLDASGTTRHARVVRSSPFPALDTATVSVARAMRFRPARQGSCPVPYFTSVPVTWTLESAR